MSVALDFSTNDENIHALPQNLANNNALLRFITCGSVDDGKSTLIGRLLYETGSIYEDQQESLAKDSLKFGTTGDDIDFALLVDGLAAEREQGITIDVAYRYFSSQERSFIIADTPGHEQYTRNMATGASQADLAIILIDARKGVLPQTRRHAFITSMVGIKSVIVAINKMDLVNYDEDIFNKIVTEFTTLLPKLSYTQVRFIPLSAKNGDNLVKESVNLPWYNGPTLLEYLNNVSIKSHDTKDNSFRMPVQWVNRPNLDFRGFCGTIANGEVKVGQEILALPSGASAHIKNIYGPNGKVETANKDDAITITLKGEIDISRGDVLVAINDDSYVAQAINTRILWLSNTPLSLDKRLLMRIATTSTPIKIQNLDYKIDIHSYENQPAQILTVNEIGNVDILIEKPIVVRSYEDDPTFGAFILIDPYTNETLALGTVLTVAKNDNHLNDKQSEIKQNTIQKITSLWLNPYQTMTPRELIRSRFINAVLLAILVFLLSNSAIASLFIIIFEIFLRPFIYALNKTKKLIKTDELKDGAGI